MAHPKLATVVQRSLLTATTAALMVGPLAGAGLAADLGGLTDSLENLTCDEAKETEDELLIDEFCTDAEAEATESPLDKSVDEVTKTVDDTTNEVEDAVAPTNDDGTTDGGDGGSSDPGELIDDTTDEGGKAGSKDVESTDDGSGFRGVDEGSGSGSGSKDGGSKTTTGSNAPAGSYGYNADGPLLPGMRSNSSLTLQPFAAPLVSVPPIYELPQIASQLFGSDSAATAQDPQVAGATTATGYSPTGGYSATSADPTGWLAATATGLIMLVGAGHAINGGRTPKGHRA